MTSRDWLDAWLGAIALAVVTYAAMVTL